ncbi:MAG: nucleoside hydrolase, partial [Bryobacteraceae bacterium]
MGGAVKVQGNASRTAEFNFWFDPEAAQIVLRSGIPEKIMFGLDICNRAPFGRPLFDKIVAAKTSITELYRQDYGGRYPASFHHPGAKAYLWDELAAAYLIDPAFVTASETAYLDVDTHYGPNYGAVTALDRKLAPNATPLKVMLDLNYPRVSALYESLLKFGDRLPNR